MSYFNSIIKLTTLSILSVLLFSCSVSHNNEVIPNWVKETDKASQLEYTLTRSADQFGQNLAKHILNHPDIADNIHCALIPSNKAYAAGGSTVANNSENIRS